MDSGKQWYVATKGQRSGPFTQSELLRQAMAGEVDIGSRVFSEGMSDWEPITVRAEFAAAFSHVPPPPAAASAPPPTPSKPAPPLKAPVPPRRVRLSRFLLTLLLGVGGFFAAVAGYHEMGIRILPDADTTAMAGAVGGLLLGLLFLRPFSRSSPASFSGLLGIVLGALGLYAAYFAYDPPRYEAYRIADGSTDGRVTFTSDSECFDWTQEWMFQLTQTMNDNPDQPYVGLEVLDCRQFCPNKLECFVRVITGRH